jgi:hypothetical protein
MTLQGGRAVGLSRGAGGVDVYGRGSAAAFVDLARGMGNGTGIDLAAGTGPGIEACPGCIELGAVEREGVSAV